ncbi:hypothetical protein BCV70DRAFT_206391 [Testicularia cyperi]|uniref:Uncharacterized protein n=1 Tax=Testicularia cyperi TaxID=1882483 RepID=A0A317XQE4_9BASI|nr:hypothetical protein BCV70DRAFT_206391 [Testicularia cyperi]
MRLSKSLSLVAGLALATSLALVTASKIDKRSLLQASDVTDEVLISAADNFDEWLQLHVAPSARQDVRARMSRLANVWRQEGMAGVHTPQPISSFRSAPLEYFPNLKRFAKLDRSLPAGIEETDIVHLKDHYLGHSKDGRLIFSAPRADGSYFYVPHPSYFWLQTRLIPTERLSAVSVNGLDRRLYSHGHYAMSPQSEDPGKMAKIAIKIDDKNFLLVDNVPLNRIGYATDRYDPVYFNKGTGGLHISKFDHKFMPTYRN